jgi:BirA family transcriptional regulator, biotin operon repressor / biotin---[acetyl-CoA-carboxylase] ligase
MSGAPALPPPFWLATYDTLGSTNDEAKRLARAGAAEGLVVTAERQTAGRGRRGRHWSSPAGNLYASIVLRPQCRAAVAAQLGFVAALGLTDAIDQLAPALAVECKWPNDLLANGRKVCGILLEAELMATDVPDFVVIGSGVNVVASPPDAAYPATSLVDEGAAGITPLTMLAAYLRCFAAWLACWQDKGFAPIREAWLARAIGRGGPIRVRLEHETLDGRFRDLDDDGALLLDMPRGTRRIAVGEIFPVTA